MGSVGANKGSANRNTLREDVEAYRNNPLVAARWSAAYTEEVRQASQEMGGEARQANRATRISQAKFTEEGNGNWQMDIPDIGGGQVLDETGSTRAYREGFMPNAKVYSASAWTYDENGAPTVTDLGTFNRRNQAQTAIRNLLKGNRRI